MITLGFPVQDIDVKYQEAMLDELLEAQKQLGRLDRDYSDCYRIFVSSDGRYSCRSTGDLQHFLDMIAHFVTACLSAAQSRRVYTSQHARPLSDVTNLSARHRV
jgi:hypothetical protein